MAQNTEIYNPTDESVVVYRSADNAVLLNVRVSDETVWLTQLQMADLFGTQRQAITKHIKNIYECAELQPVATSSILEQVQKEGKREVARQIAIYNLDMIISVGYRVNTIRGIQFRQWATKVLNQYIRQGYAISNRFERLEQRMTQVESQIESFVHYALPPKEGIFYAGQIYDAFELVERLIKSTKKSIILIDNYVDESVLTMMSEKAKGVKVDIYTKEVPKALTLAATKFNDQYGNLTLHQTNNVHDRFLILDDEKIYLIGASLKDAGKRLFAFTEMSKERIEELQKAL